MPEAKVPDEAMRRVALALVEHCVRNRRLEDIHAGTTPDSRTGDFSDVKVVTPHGEIPWTEASRISDAEMQELMIEIVNKVYTFLTHLEDTIVIRDSAGWKRPQHDPGLLSFTKRRATARRAEDQKKD